METEASGKKYIRITPEVSVTVCAATRDTNAQEKLSFPGFDDHFQKPNMLWNQDPHHERARLKVYKNDPEQTVIPMPFLGQNANDGWAELQLRIKEKIVRLVNGRKETINLKPVLIGRHQSFDPRIGEFGEWAAETQPIRPTEVQKKRGHYFLPFRIYHQGYLPETPGDWHWEPVYIAVGVNKEFYRIDVLWEKEEVAITVTPLDSDSPEIPEHIKTNEAAVEKVASTLRRAR